MKGMDKRLSSRAAKTLLAVVLAIGLCPTPAYADREPEEFPAYSEDQNRLGSEGEGSESSGVAGEGVVNSAARDDADLFFGDYCG